MAPEPQGNESSKPAVEKEPTPELVVGDSQAKSAEKGLSRRTDQQSSNVDAEYENLDMQDNYVETKEPSELMFCVILSSIYAGLARYCWTPLEQSHYWYYFINIEGFFITISLLSLLLGLRPYLSPSSLQISKHGIKYRGPYWPQRKTVNWSQVAQMYVSPELILILYKLPNKPKSIRPLLVHSVYLADRDKIPDSIVKYSPVEATFVANPGLLTRTAQILLFAAIVLWIANILKG